MMRSQYRYRLSSISYAALGFFLVGLLGADAAMAVEEPAFQATLIEGACEVRDYPALTVAEVQVEGSRNAAANAGFRLIASYIFGNNRRRETLAASMRGPKLSAESEKIAMTAPVTQYEHDGSWTVRFVMPSIYTLDTLPVPDDTRVHLRAVPPQRIAVVRFSGLAQPADVEQKTVELRAFVVAHGLKTREPSMLARYNPPWTPWFMRRNEVMLVLSDSDAP